MDKDELGNLCTLYTVRHGETEWNVERITQGQMNSVLTENGKEQAKKVAKEFKDIHFDAIFSSDLTRTERTAEIIRLDRDLEIQTSKLLRERRYGRFEGMTETHFKEFLKTKLAERENVSEDGNWSFKIDPDIETDEEISERFVVKLREIAVAYPGKTVLVVSHGGTIRSFLERMGYAPKGSLKGGSFKNAGYIKVLSDGVDFFIKEVNGIRKPEGSE